MLFWQVKLNITQAPQPFEPKLSLEGSVPDYQESEGTRSFLYDPFGAIPSATYGLKLTANKNIQVEFFTKADSEADGIEIGYAWLSDLKHNFVGMDGTVEIEPIPEDIEAEFKSRQLREIILPEGIIRRKINIVERFIDAFYFDKKNKVDLIILWQRNPIIDKNFAPESANYSVRLFLSYDVEILNLREQQKFLGILRFLFSDIEDKSGRRAFIKKPNEISMVDILEGDIFHGTPEERLVITEEMVNFDFPENIPLPKLPILKSEIVRYIDINSDFKKMAIKAGYHIKNGVITNHKTYIPIKKLQQDVAIFGKSGSGKTYLLAMLIEELCKKAPYVGILVLNVAKESQEIYYENKFTVIKYSDDDFHIPYYIESDKYNLERRLQETATYICASLGLKNIFEKMIYRSEVGLLNLEGKLPTFFYSLLKAVENYMIKNKYGPEEQANLMQAFKNRMNVFNEEKIQTVLKLSEELPKWLINWMMGENIYLDLSMCSKYIKLLIVNAIFQLVRTVTEDCEAEELKHLIVIDEAHAILEKPITTNADDADFIMKEQMAKIFSELLKEYRSRGVGFIIADQSPDNLFKDVASQPSIKIIFREDYPNNVLFSEDPIERQMLTQLPNRIAMVINGATGEKYLIKTLDYNIIK